MRHTVWWQILFISSYEYVYPLMSRAQARTRCHVRANTRLCHLIARFGCKFPIFDFSIFFLVMRRCHFSKRWHIQYSIATNTLFVILFVHIFESTYINHAVCSTYSSIIWRHVAMCGRSNNNWTSCCLSTLFAHTLPLVWRTVIFR